MYEAKTLGALVAEAFTNNAETVTINKWMALKIVTDLDVLAEIRKQTGILDRRDQLEQEGRNGNI